MPLDDQWAPPLPEAVRRAAARAEELAREAGVANVPASPDTSPSGVPPPGTSPGDNPEGSEQSAEAPTVGTTQESSGAAPPEASPAPVDNLPPVSSPAPSGAPDWEQRYQTLQGKYNSELPELRGQIRSLQDLIASMQRADTRAAEVKRSAPTVPPEDVDAYGQDLITASQRWAEAHLNSRFADYERRLSQVETGGEQLARHTAAQGVESQLDRQIANWREINVDPKFIMWLDQTDPFTGQKRQTLLNDAYGAGDSPRTIAFFRAYLNEQTAVTPANGAGIRPTHTNGGAPPPGAERLPLAELAVPGRGREAAPPAPGAPDRRNWTNSDIAAFYDAKTRGRWAGREADAAAIEQDIFAAMREGRIQ
jgi:hypothetical protein